MVRTERHHLLGRRLARFTRMLHGVEEGNANAVHRTRVASRRLREVLPVLQIDPDVSRKISRRLRKITDRLGTVREFDVLLGVLDGLEKVARYPKGALARIAAHVGQDRGRARRRLLEKVPIGDLRRVAAKLERVADKLEKGARTDESSSDSRVITRRSWRWAVDARIARRGSALSAAIADAGAVYLSERLHTVRVAVKKLRYALELAADADHVKSSPDLRQLRRAQDVLGRLHDLQVLIDRARDVQASLTPPDLNAWRELDVFVVALEEDCRRLHGRYMNEAAALTDLCSRLTGPGEQRTQKAKVRSQHE